MGNTNPKEFFDFDHGKVPYKGLIPQKREFYLVWALKKFEYWHENMSYAQKYWLDRIRHTSLLTTEKNFIENERKMLILHVFLESQQLMPQPNKYPAVQKKWRADRSVIFFINFWKKSPWSPFMFFSKIFEKNWRGDQGKFFFKSRPENPGNRPHPGSRKSCHSPSRKISTRPRDQSRTRDRTLVLSCSSTSQRKSLGPINRSKFSDYEKFKKIQHRYSLNCFYLLLW